MKRIFAIIGCVSIFLTLSCTREKLVQDEPVVKAKTYITLTADNTKTTVGELSEGVRAVYWANGDKVAVNGVVSEPLSELPANCASATFEFNSLVEPPFNAVYPETSWKDEFSVTLPQQAKSGILPLVGYGNAESMSVKPITAVIKLSVKKYSGENPDLDKIVSVAISSEDTQLSGDFAVDFQTGELTPYLNPIEQDRIVTIRPNLTLTDAAQDLFIPVPAGSYNFKVRLTDVQGHFMEISTTSPKTFVAGRIKAFPEIEFVPTGTAIDVVISSPADLIKFAADWNSGVFEGKEPIVHVSTDLVFDGESSAAFSATGGIGLKVDYGDAEDHYFNGLFEGNGHSITGLVSTAPLFKATGSDGIVQNLTLDNTCSFTFTHPNTAQAAFGSVVSYHKGILDNISSAASVSLAPVSDVTNITALGGLVGRSTVGKLNNCTYSGLISTPAGFVGTAKLLIGGLVAYFSNEGSIEGSSLFRGAICNEAQITSTDKGDPYVVIGGVVGYLNGGAVIDGVSTKADHEAVESAYSGFKGTIVSKTTVAYHSAVGGIVGVIDNGTVVSCNNSATIAVSVFKGSDATGRYIKSGGIVGMNKASGIVSDCVNNGTVQHRSNPRIQDLGGIVGYNLGSVASCTNNANVSQMTSGQDTAAGRVVSIGGIVGQNAKGSSLTDVHNSGNIQISSMENGTSSDVKMGGVIGYNLEAIDGGSSKSITNTGQVYFSPIFSKQFLGYSAGGVVGHSNASVSNVRNAGYVYFRWNVDKDKQYVASKIFVGGVVGRAEADITLSGCVNEGGEANAGEVYLNIAKAVDDANKEIIIKHTGNCVGGILGSSIAGKNITIENCVNSGYVHTSQFTGTDMTLYIAGIAGALYGASSVKNCNNTGYTYLNASNNQDDDVTKMFADGGIVGVAQGTAAGHITISGCNWSYPVDKVVGPRRGLSGGVAAYAEYADISDSEVTVQYSRYNRVIGGVVGKAVHSSIKNCSFKGPKLTGTEGRWVGGIVAKLTEGSVVDGCFNYCKDISSPKSEEGNVKGEIAAVSEAETEIKNCHHTGTIAICSDTNFTDGGGNVADL